MPIDKLLYTATATATGGRDGKAFTPDRKLDVKMAKPTEMGGKGDGVNPEQLFAAGYSACFLGALKFVASKESVTIPDNASVNARVGIGTVQTGFGLEVELKIALPGLDRTQAKSLIAKAHLVCPYSHSLRGNVDVKLLLA
jgi:Ohr subfamily peroxiredoxin